MHVFIKSRVNAISASPTLSFSPDIVVVGDSCVAQVSISNSDSVPISQIVLVDVSGDEYVLEPGNLSFMIDYVELSDGGNWTVRLESGQEYPFSATSDIAYLNVTDKR